MKITTPADLAAARTRVQPSVSRVGTGYDLHRLAEGRPLVLAGVTLSPDRGPVSHSDGDVVCHALIDAMLGAAAAGDIGRHFPNTDPPGRTRRVSTCSRRPPACWMAWAGPCRMST
jgi:hypothetical protein